MNGTLRPIPFKMRQSETTKLLRAKDNSGNDDDRIIKQLMFVPENYEEIKRSNKTKIILIAADFGLENGRGAFAECPVNTCEISSDAIIMDKADMVIFSDGYVQDRLAEVKKPNQIFMMYLLESPSNIQAYQGIKFPNIINWTSTFRSDSDIVAPYEKWVYYDPNIQQITQEKNYALNKKKKIAWFVSNCAPKNSRMIYAKELSQHIQVDIYGGCGSLKCERNSQDCEKLIDNEYKFYLAFENSNCHDYITEKFFVNGLKRNVLPIVVSKYICCAMMENNFNSIS